MNNIKIYTWLGTCTYVLKTERDLYPVTSLFLRMQLKDIPEVSVF